MAETEGAPAPQAHLKPANQNPWYVLATLHGEQEGHAVDHDLAAKNRQVWNLWACAGMDDVTLATRAKAVGLEPEDLVPFTGGKRDRAEAEERLEEIEERVLTRLRAEGVEAPKMPVAGEKIELFELHFENFVSFGRFIFEGPTFFDKSVFEDTALFNFAKFDRNTSFSFVRFGGGARFVRTVFGGTARFDSASFGGPALFDGAEFIGGGWFGAAMFSGNIEFNYTVFRQHAWFGSATFNCDANFNLAKFGTIAWFNSASFRSIALFVSARFNGGANFRSTNFFSRTDFSGARFLTHVPEFYAASLYEDTVFPIPEDYRANWPPLSGEVEGKEVMEATQQKRAYSRLRLFMDKGLQIDEAQFFHRMEMRAKRQTEGRAYRWLYSAFALLSDYGNSVLRPVGWLFAVLMAGWPFMLWHLQGESAATGAQFTTALGWSLSNTLPFSGFGRVYYNGFAEGLPIWLKVIGGAQVIVAMVLLFLLGLGLRNRFRLR